MSIITDLNGKTRDLINQAYFLDADDPDDVEELEAINKSIMALASQAENIADWLASRIHDATFAEKQADDLARKFAKKKKAATSRLEFFKAMALDFMITHNINESRGDLFKISRSLTPGALMFDEDFNPELLPDDFTVMIPAVPEHKEAAKQAISEALRFLIKDEKGKLDQHTEIVISQLLPGVKMVRSQSLRVK